MFLAQEWVSHVKLTPVLKKIINMQVSPFSKQLQRNPFQFSTEYRKVKSGF